MGGRPEHRDLYGIIKRLLAEGLIREAVAERRAQNRYRLTPFGRKVALAEAERLRVLVAAAKKLLQEPA